MLNALVRFLAPALSRLTSLGHFPLSSLANAAILAQCVQKIVVKVSKAREMRCNMFTPATDSHAMNSFVLMDAQPKKFTHIYSR